MQRALAGFLAEEALPAGVFDDEVAHLDDRRSRVRNVPRREAARHRGEQLARIGMLRLAQEILGCALLDDLALAHHDDAVGVARDHRGRG